MRNKYVVCNQFVIIKPSVKNVQIAFERGRRKLNFLTYKDVEILCYIIVFLLELKMYVSVSSHRIAYDQTEFDGIAQSVGKSEIVYSAVGKPHFRHFVEIVYRYFAVVVYFYYTV